jgi:hypothetical protein
VIAGVLKRQMDEAKTLGANQVVATDDDTAIANLPPRDAVADAVGGRIAEKMIAKVKPGECLLRFSGRRRTPRGTHL